MAKFLFVTDLDNTLVGDEQALAQLNNSLQKHRQGYGTRIIYATGRSPDLYQELKEAKNLLDPDALVLSVGTEIYIHGSPHPDSTWAEKISSGWNRHKVVATTTQFPELKPQPESEQRPLKVSFFLEQSLSTILPQLESELLKSKLNVKLIYSSGKDLDIVPQSSDKGQAVQFLQQKWKFVAEHTVVCGDSGNDIALFANGVERGIIVGNAQTELLQWHNEHPNVYHYLAQNSCAGGILEGLEHFGFLK